MIAVDVRFPNSDTACGEKIALDVTLGSPCTLIAKAIGRISVASAGSATLPLNVT
jgi:hypothetical protein